MRTLLGSIAYIKYRAFLSTFLTKSKEGTQALYQKIDCEMEIYFPKYRCDWIRFMFSCPHW